MTKEWKRMERKLKETGKNVELFTFSMLTLEMEDLEFMPMFEIWGFNMLTLGLGPFGGDEKKSILQKNNCFKSGLYTPWTRQNL